MTRATAIIPVKRFGAAKQRLLEALDRRQRAALSAAMLADVLAATCRAELVVRTIVVTGDRRAERIALQTGTALSEEIEVLREPADRGHSEAATLGIVRAKALGAECAVLLPGDCPLLDPVELDAALTRARAGRVGIVPDRHGTGTNALILAPPDAIAPAFGPDSCERHADRGRMAGHVVEIEALESLGLDLDTADDLTALTAVLDRNPTIAPTTAAVLDPDGRSRSRSGSVTRRVELIGVPGLPEIEAGAHLGTLLADAIRAAGEELAAGDVVVVSQKVVSKAEGRVMDLAEVDPGPRAVELAERLARDPRLVELILRESRAVVRAEPQALIVETRGGWICANAGIDASNVPGDERVTLLPEDPDDSARRIRAELEVATGTAPAVVIADSFGRPWRLGQTDVAIGCAGLVPLDDRRGKRDREGRPLAATVIAIADQVSAAADLTRAKDEGIPACIVRGLDRYVTAEDEPGRRIDSPPRGDDLFR